MPYQFISILSRINFIPGIIKEMQKLNNKLAQFGFEPKLAPFQKWTENHSQQKPYSTIVDKLLATSK